MHEISGDRLRTFMGLEHSSVSILVEDSESLHLGPRELNKRRQKRLDEVVHEALKHPEAMYYRSLGDGVGIWIVKNNTIMPTDRRFLGGCRIKRYNSQQDALQDALYLGRGMTHKWGILNLMMAHLALQGNATTEEFNATAIGGGKSVIFDPNFEGGKYTTKGPLNDLERAMLDKIVPFLHEVQDYVFAPDVGTRVEHVDYVRQKTQRNTACFSESLGGSGDPSVITAKGVYISMLEAVKHHLQREGVDGLTILVQGLGKTGSPYIENIIAQYPRVKLLVSDTDVDKWLPKVNQLKEQGIDARYVHHNKVYDQEWDVFSPMAVGQVLNPPNVRRMIAANPNKRLVIVGSANNQLDEIREGYREEAEQLFRDNGIFYVPDFVANLGGIENLTYEDPGVKRVFDGRYQREIPLQRIEGVRIILNQIIKLSGSRPDMSTQSLAERLAEEQIARWATWKKLTLAQIREKSYLH